MQREGGNGGVRIGIFPRVCRARIVDREKLDEFQSDFFAPIGERLEIEKLPSAKAVFAAETENGNRHACAAPVFRRQIYKTVVNERLFVRRDLIVQNPVRALLKPHEGILFDIKQAIFVGEWKRLAAQIKLRGQIVFTRATIEQNRPASLPVAENLAFAEQAKCLIFF